MGVVFVRCGFCLVLFLCGVADHFWCIFMTLDKIVYDKLYVATCSLLSPPSRSFPRAILASFHPTLKREKNITTKNCAKLEEGAFLLWTIAFYLPIFWKLEGLEFCGVINSFRTAVGKEKHLSSHSSEGDL